MDRIAAIRQSMAVFVCGSIGAAFIFGLVPVGFLVMRSMVESSMSPIADYIETPQEPAHDLLWWMPTIVLMVLGLIPAIWALLGWGRIRVRYGSQWNPAAAYLSWGIRLTVMTLLVSALIVSAIVLMVL
jgi:hypothetical protein